MILVALLACHPAEPPVDQPPSLDDRVRWEAVTDADVLPVATLPAEVVPAPRSSVVLGPPANGRIIRWLVLPGDTVSEGQPIAEIASPELAGVGSRVSQLTSRVAALKQADAMAQQAAARGVISQREAQIAAADLSQARSSLASTRTELAAYGASGSAGTFAWRAPESGIAGEISCPVGPVSSTDACLTIQHDQAVQLTVRVPERYLALLSERATADFTSASGATAHFVETQRSPSVDRATRSVLLQFKTSDPAPLAGTSGRATLRVPAIDGLTQLPVSALTRIDGQHTVFVRTDKHPEARSVRVHAQDAQVAVVEGVDPPAEIAVTGVFLLKSITALEDQ